MNNNMMSSTNADVNTNANLVNAEVIKVITFDLMFEGWKNWSLQDILGILRDMKSYGLGAAVMGNIVLFNLFEEAGIRMFLSR